MTSILFFSELYLQKCALRCYRCFTLVFFLTTQAKWGHSNFLASYLLKGPSVLEGRNLIRIPGVTTLLHILEETTSKEILNHISQ